MSSSLELSIYATRGPLFLIREVDGEDTVDTTAKERCVAQLRLHFPQFYKKHCRGWRLSIEELEYLLSRHGSTLPSADSSGEEPCVLSVHLCGDAVVRQRELLARANPISCEVYRLLMGTEEGLLLRHGSQFGALFIGYGNNNVAEHGEVLFYLDDPPLTEWMETAAARVAASVGKKAEGVSIRRHNSGTPATTPAASSVLVRRPLLGRREGVVPPRKRIRKG